MVEHRVIFRVLIACLAAQTLSGCLAAVGAAASAGVVGATSAVSKGQAHDLNRQLARSDMEAAHAIGVRRHPDVFGRMSVDDEFYCLFRQEYPTYAGLIKSRGAEKAAEIAVDNAAARSRAGECDEGDRLLKAVNPFDLS
jgi:hypothetical protein